MRAAWVAEMGGAYKVEIRARFSGSPEAMKAFVLEAVGGPEHLPTADNQEDWGYFVLDNIVPFPPIDQDPHLARYGRFCARVVDAEPSAMLAYDFDPDLRETMHEVFDPVRKPDRQDAPRTLAEGRDWFVHYAVGHHEPFEPLEVARAYRDNEIRFGAGSAREWIVANWSSEIVEESHEVEEITRGPAGEILSFRFNAEADEVFPRRLFEAVARRHPGVRIDVNISRLDSDDNYLGKETWSANAPTSKARTAAPGMG
jgi:hypothetical protein